MPSSANVLGRPAPIRGDWSVSNETFKVTAGQSFKVGDWVYAVSGKLSVCCTTGNNCGSGVLPLGMALMDAADALAADVICPVEVPGPTGEFLVQIQHDTPASAVLALTDLDDPVSYPLGLIGSTWVADIESNGTEDRLVIVGFDLADAPGDQYGRVWARLLLAKQIWQSAT